MNEIQEFIVRHVRANPAKIVPLAAEKFGITRQGVHRHIDTLLDKNLLMATGHTRARKYELVPIVDESIDIDLTVKQDEDKVWREFALPHLKTQKDNVLEICRYGFTEMLNNAIDHSRGQKVRLLLSLEADRVLLSVIDDGIGIFRQIKQKCELDDEHQAILELSKGKLTTDPARHSGEGIFFTSRAFRMFHISSFGLIFVTDSDWDLLMDADMKNAVHHHKGTVVAMDISPYSDRTLADVFDEHTTQDAGTSIPGFNRTTIALRLATYESDGLVSRSQAKRVINRAEKFKEVILDFEGISSIGQAFADEVFRVFQSSHPNVRLIPRRTVPDVARMIAHVKAGAEQNEG